MAVHVLKDQEQKSQSQSNGITQTKRTDTLPINIYDQNFEADSQNSVSGLGNADYGVSRLSSLQNKANSSTKITQLAELQKKADQHTIQTKSKYQKNNSNKDNVIQLMGSAILRGVGSTLGRNAGRLGTALGVGNAAHDAAQAYFDPKTKGLETAGNMALNVATGFFGKAGSVGNAASVIKAGLTINKSKENDPAAAASPLVHEDTSKLEFALHSGTLAKDGVQKGLEVGTGHTIDNLKAGFGSGVAKTTPGLSKLLTAGIGLVDFKSAVSSITKGVDGDASSPITNIMKLLDGTNPPTAPTPTAPVPTPEAPQNSPKPQKQSTPSNFGVGANFANKAAGMAKTFGGEVVGNEKLLKMAKPLITPGKFPNLNPVLTPNTSQSEEQEPNPEKGLDLREISKILESNGLLPKR